MSFLVGCHFLYNSNENLSMKTLIYVLSATSSGVKMGLGIASSIGLFLHLLLFMCAHGSEFHTQNQEINNIELLGNHNHNHPSSHMMNPQDMIFFTFNDLILGKKMLVYFRQKDTSARSPHLLPREQADSIPLSFKELQNLLRFFSFSPGSPQAKAMEDTLRLCEIKPFRGETKFCATSFESMLDFVRGVFGLDSTFSVVTTTHYTDSHVTFQNYTILEVPKEILAPKMVACHTMPYPYVVYYCHSQKSENKVFRVPLRGDNGERVEAVAVCHMDTSQWSRDHASFRMLGMEPGTDPVCHFFPDDNLVWVPEAVSASI